MRKYLLILAAGVACLLGVTACSRGADELKEGLEVGNKFPNYESFAAQTVSGDTFKFNGNKGKYLLIDFWATWCGPCEQELPYLTRIHETYVGDKFAMVGISLDFTLTALFEGVKTYGLGYPQICDEKGWDSKYAKMFSIQSIPANFLLDGNGIIVAKDLRGLAAVGRVAKVLGRDEPVVHYTETLDYLESSEEPDVKKAQEMLAKAIEGDPEEPEFQFLAGQLSAADGDSTAAITYFTAGLEHKDRLPIFRPALLAYVRLGEVHFAGGDTEKAVAALDDAIEAINALEGAQKRAYSGYIPEIEKLKRHWQSGAKE